MVSVAVLGLGVAAVVLAIGLVVFLCVLWKYVNLKRIENEEKHSSNEEKERLSSDTIKMPDFEIPMYYHKVQPVIKDRSKSAEYVDKTKPPRKITSRKPSDLNQTFTESDLHYHKEDILLIPFPARQISATSGMGTKVEALQKKIAQQMLLNLKKQQRRDKHFCEDGYLSTSSCDFSSGAESDKNEEVFDSPSVARARRRMGTRRKIQSTKPTTKYKKEGKLFFSSIYDKEKHVLEIFIKRISHIANKRDISDTNPYVQLYLDPGKKQKQKTQFHRATKDAQFNESFLFTDMKEDEIGKYRLKLKVLNHGRFRKNEVLAEVCVEVAAFDLRLKETYDVDLFVKRPESSLPSVLITLSHQPRFSKLEVTINEAKYLRKKGSLNADVFAIAALYKDGEVEKKNTMVQRNTGDPDFKETMDFYIITDNNTPFNVFSLVVTIMHHVTIGPGKMLGHVIFSLSSPQQTALEHWRDIHNQPYERLSRWHSLLDPDDI